MEFFALVPGPVPHRRDGFFTRRQAAIEVRCTVANLRQLQGKGVLTGEYDKRKKVWWYTAAEIAQVRRYMDNKCKPSRGELTARAFEMFGSDANDRVVVMELRITTTMLDRLRKEYDREEWRLAGETVRAIRVRLGQSGIACREPGELLHAIDRLCTRDRELARIELSEASPPIDALAAQ